MTRIRCEMCCGRGERDLSEIEADTFGAVPTDWGTTADIAQRISFPRGISIQALANRLVRLERLGLVERRPLTGKTYAWRAKARSRKAA